MIPNFEASIMPYFTTHPEGELALDYDVLKPLRAPSPTESFAKLPLELREMILAHLSSRDIAHLLLTSRAFRFLTKSLFRRLLTEEKPWFWELNTLLCSYEKKPYNEANAESLDALSSHNPKQELNWLSVWTGLQHLQQRMHGVRNRARIWRLCEDIVSRIERMRDCLAGSELLIQPSDAVRQKLHELMEGLCVTCRKL